MNDKQERAAFESWWKCDLIDWRGHESVPARHAWEAWQARASLAAQPVLDPMREEAAWLIAQRGADKTVDRDAMALYCIRETERHHGISKE